MLDLASGETSYYQGDDVFMFLDDWLPILASQILELRQLRYDLNNAEDWMLQVAAQVDEGLIEVPDLDAEGKTVTDAQGRTIAVKDTEGTIITKFEHQYRFYCPDCGRVIMDVPRGEAVVTEQVDIDSDVADAQDQEALAPIGDIAHFRFIVTCCGPS